MDGADGQAAEGCAPPDPETVGYASHWWVNLASGDGRSELHDHADSTYAAVVHATAGAPLVLRLEPEIPPDPVKHGGWLGPAIRRSGRGAPVRTQYAVVRAEPGAVVVFPGWLPHAVPAGGSSAVRVSAAVNFDLAYLMDPARPWLIAMPEGVVGSEDEEDEEDEEDDGVVDPG